MTQLLGSAYAILIGVSVLVLGNGALTTLVSVRAGLAGFSNLTTATVMSLYFFGFIAGIYIGPRVVARVGHIRTFAIMAAIASATALLHGMFVGPYTWAVFRFISGVSLLGVYLVAESWLNSLADNESRGKLLALYVLLTLSAMGGGQFMLLTGDPRGLEMFAVSAIFLSLSLVPVAFTRVHVPAPLEPPATAFGMIWSTTPLGLVGVAAAGMVNSVFISLMPLYGTRIGLSQKEIYLLMGATIMGGALLQWPIGKYSDLSGDRRKSIVAVCFGAAVLALFFLVSTRMGFVSLAITGFAYGGLAFALHPMAAAHSNDYVPHDKTLEAAGTLLVVFGVGAFTAPLLTGFMMDVLGVWSLPAFLALSFSVVGGYSLYRMGIRKAAPESQTVEFLPMTSTSQGSLELDPRIEQAPDDDPRYGQDS